MRHEEQRAGVFTQIAFEPADRIDVEVIGRLVEQEQIRAETSALPRSARRRHPPDSSPCDGRPADRGERRRARLSARAASRRAPRARAGACRAARVPPDPCRRPAPPGGTRLPAFPARRGRSATSSNTVRSPVARNILLEPRDAKAGARQIDPPSGFDLSRRSPATGSTCRCRSAR